MLRTTLLLAALLLVLHPPAAPAMQAVWRLDLSAGYTTYEAAAAQIRAGSIIAGMRAQLSGSSSLYLYGGTPLEGAGVLWGAAGTGHRHTVPVGGVSWARLGADFGLHALGYRDSEVRERGAAATVEVLPLLVLQRGRAILEVHSGLRQHTTWHEETRATRRAHESRARVGVAVLPEVRLRADARYLRAEEADYPFAGASVEMARGRMYAWASVGRWLTDSILTPSYAAGLTWHLDERWEVHAAGQYEVNDPLYWNLPRRTWSVGLSRRLGRASASGLQPATALRDAEGRITLRFPLQEASPTPRILGEFTGWEPLPMSAEGGFWTIRLAVRPGVYRYGFRDAEGRWFLPRSIVHRADDGMGGTTAVLIVP